MKVLLNAYACHPNLGSECAVGWNWLIRIAKEHEVWLLTESNRYQKPTISALSTMPDIEANVHVIGVSRKRYGENISHLFYYHSYRKWQKEAYQVAKELNKDINFDITHQLNMIGYREPGYIYKLGKPHIWGPIGGYCQMPMGYFGDLGIKGMIHYGSRNFVNRLQMQYSKHVKNAIYNSNFLVAATSVDQISIKNYYNKNAYLLSETGTHEISKKSPRAWNGHSKLKLIWVGALIPRKGLHIALHTIANIKHILDVELHILGTGEYEGRYRKLAKSLGINNSCIWHGQVDKKNVYKLMDESHLLFFTSIQDANPHVAYEALHAGLPIICHNAFCMLSLIDNTCGIKVPMQNSKHSIKEFSKVFTSLTSNPNLINTLSNGAYNRAEKYTWNSLTRKMLELYASATQ